MKQEKEVLYWHMAGDRFSPRLIQTITGLQFSYQHEPGEAVRHKAGGTTLLMNTGLATLQVELTVAVDWRAATQKFIHILEHWHTTLLDNGLESLIFQVDVLYIKQCNLALDSSIVQQLSRLGASLAMSAYKQ